MLCISINSIQNFRLVLLGSYLAPYNVFNVLLDGAVLVLHLHYIHKYNKTFNTILVYGVFRLVYISMLYLALCLKHLNGNLFGLSYYVYMQVYANNVVLNCC